MYVIILPWPGMSLSWKEGSLLLLLLFWVCWLLVLVLLCSPGRRAVVGSVLASERARESHVGRGGGCLAGGGNPVAIRQCGQGNADIVL